jgi:hypothetical protein
MIAEFPLANWFCVQPKRLCAPGNGALTTFGAC